jgi:hypothetical protein
MMILEDRTHHLIAVVVARVLTVIVLIENLTVLAVTWTVRAGTRNAQAGTVIVTGISEIIIDASVIAGTATTTGPGIQMKDETTEGIVKVAGAGALALVIGAEAEAGAGGAEAGAGAGAGVGAGTSSDPAHSGMDIKRRQPQSQAT